MVTISPSLIVPVELTEPDAKEPVFPLQLSVIVTVTWAFKLLISALKNSTTNSNFENSSLSFVVVFSINLIVLFVCLGRKIGN